MANTVKVKLVKGLIGTRETHRATVRGLGLRGINSVSELEDTPAVRGMINNCLLYTSPSPRDQRGSRMPSSA